MANMTDPKLGEGSSASMQNFSSDVDASELGACCLDLLPSTSASSSGTKAMRADMFSPEYCNQLADLIDSIENLPNDLQEKTATNIVDPNTPNAKYTFQDQSINYLYGSVIRDAEIALHEIQNQPETKKSEKMLEYYSNHCPFILGLARQEKASCINDKGVCNDELRFKELEIAEECLDRLINSFFAEKRHPCKK